MNNDNERQRCQLILDNYLQEFCKIKEQYNYAYAVLTVSIEEPIAIVYMITDPVTNVKYIGSKKSWHGHNTYWGSMKCSAKHAEKYANQQRLKEAISTRAETLKFDILEIVTANSNNITSALLQTEIKWQRQFNVISDKTFANAAFAGWHGRTTHETIESKTNRKQNISKGLATASAKEKMRIRNLKTNSEVNKIIIAYQNKLHHENKRYNKLCNELQKHNDRIDNINSYDKITCNVKNMYNKSIKWRNIIKSHIDYIDNARLVGLTGFELATIESSIKYMF